MSNIVPFTPRPPAGDWTSGELARLGELADRLAAGGARVQAAYGVSDEGDPWCVIQDEHDEVLIHVARIDGAFVVHDAARDAVQHEDSLWSAMERLLGKAWRDGSSVIALDMRQAQALLALIMAATFVEEAIRDGRQTAAHFGEPDADHDPTTPPLHAEPGAGHAPDGEGHLALQNPTFALRGENPLAGAHPAESTITDPAADLRPPGTGSLTAGASVATAALPALAQAEPMAPPQAETHGMVLAGGPGGDHLIGGMGADTLSGGGVGPGKVDLLEGGGGDDRIQMAAGVVARGGPGADSFVVSAKPTPPPAFNAQVNAAEPAKPTAEGVILDFAKGDHLVSANGAAAVIVSITATTDVLSGLHGATNLGRTVETPGVRVGVDFNGDGHEDAYVLVAGPGIASLTVTAPVAANDASAPPAVHELEPAAQMAGGAQHYDILLG